VVNEEVAWRCTVLDLDLKPLEDQILIISLYPER
jgi:hypothetical protein